jgi:hypothetical protein
MSLTTQLMYRMKNVVILFEVVYIPSGDQSLLGSPNIQPYENGELGSWLMLDQSGAYHGLSFWFGLFSTRQLNPLVIRT